MTFLIDFFPLLLFFACYKFYGIYVATAVAIAASAAQLGWYWFKERKVESKHLITAIVIFVFGGLTLLFQNDAFIKWKPTIINWVFAVVLTGSLFIGKKPALEYVLGSQLELPADVWRKVTISWAVFFVVVGLLNLYVAFYYRLDLDEQARTDIWVNFKVFGLMAITIVFTIVQMLFIAKHIKTDEAEEKS